MKRLRQICLVLLGLVAVVGLAFVVPCTERLPGPEVAVLVSFPDGFRPGVTSVWGDPNLSEEYFQRELEFGPDGKAVLPSYDVPTTLARWMVKRYHTMTGRWPRCQHCYGPNAYCVLKPPVESPAPLKKWAAVRSEAGGECR